MTDTGQDDARDPWLSEALRHAPDADAAPPSAIREAILAEARAAAARPPPAQSGRTPTGRRTAVEVARAWWAALARPPVAAAFASVMAATIVGLMWWDRPMDEALPRPPSPAAERKVAAPRTEPAVPATRGTTAPSLAVPAPAVERAAPAPPRDRLQGAAPSGRAAVAESGGKDEAVTAFPSPEGPREASRPRLDEAKKKDVATPSFAQRSTAPAPVEANAKAAGAVASPPTAAAPAPPAPFSTPAAAARPADSAGPAVPARPEAGADQADPAMAKSVAPARERAPVVAATPRQRAETDLRGGADGLERERAAVDAASPEAFARGDVRPRPGGSAAAAAASPLAPLLAAIAREPQRWSRETTAGAREMLDPAWLDWLARLDAAATGRWRAGAAGPPPAEDSRDGASLRLFVDGRAAAIVRLDGPALRVDVLLDAAPGHGQARLAPDAVAGLATERARLPR
jgi:hypothetical protein